MNPGTSFGLWLKARRRSMDLTQPDLAKRVGCSLETIVKIESGERRPSKQVAERLAECLGIPADEHSAFVKYARVELSGSQPLLLTQADDRTPWRALHSLHRLLRGRSRMVRAWRTSCCWRPSCSFRAPAAT